LRPVDGFNLCAYEREYSIEAVVTPERTTEMPAPAGGVKGKRPSAVAAALDPVLVAGVWQLSRCSASRQVRVRLDLNGHFILDH
jgi:hypothetical protein